MATFNFGQPVGTNPLASPPNSRTTSTGSINKNPGLGRTGFGETVTLPSGQVVSAYDAKYATYLKLFTGEMFLSLIHI